MKRFVTPRSLYNDITSGDKFTCEDDLRAPLGTLLKAMGSVNIEGKDKWKMIPILDVMEKIIETVEKLLWDSGQLSEEEQDTRERLYTRVVSIKHEIAGTINT